MAGKWMGIASAMVAAVLAGSGARADFRYTLQFEAQDVEVNKMTLHFDAGQIAFTTPGILESTDPQIVTVNPAQEINGLNVESILFSRSGILPDLPQYNFLSDPDFTVPFGSVGSIRAGVLNADHVGTYQSDLFGRGIVYDAGLGAGITFRDQSGTLVISEVEPVPEPSSLALCGAGAILVLAIARRRRRAAPDPPGRDTPDRVVVLAN